VKINTVVVLKHPLDRVWTTMRDELSALVALQDGIEEMSIQKRMLEANGHVRVVSVWQARVTVPAVAAAYLTPEMFQWTDDATWDDERHECRWRIEPHYLTERIDCSGVTRYAPAMGGRGTRITMNGEFRWNLRGFLDLPAILENNVSQGIENFVGGNIPRNFRKVTDALQRYLTAGDGNL
jgi:hypothetical protein